VFSSDLEDGPRPDTTVRITGDAEFPETMHILCAANALANSLPFSITIE
jgi:hypothetical protein